MIDLAFSPQLLVEELIETLRSLGFRDIERAESKFRGGVSTAQEVSALTISIGEGRQTTVRCAVPEDPLKALLLADVFRIARAALSLERFRREERNRAALWPVDPVETEAGVLFLSEEMQTLLTTARRVAAANVPVLITGETGTGKEVLARLIHAYSPRAKATFMPFNCTATPKDMLDSQLFGHRRGSFTGATDSFQGVIRAAGGGTLFLDEIGETTPDVQPKLLRFLESSEVHPIGEAHPTRVDVRVIAATNANLDALVAQGRFRQDLLYRLNTVILPVPPLRERRVEIPALATHYLRKYAAREPQRRPAARGRHHGIPGPLPLAGQHQATRQRDAAHGGAGREGRDAHARAPVAGTGRVTTHAAAIAARARRHGSGGPSRPADARRRRTPGAHHDSARPAEVRRPPGGNGDDARHLP